ncbi:MAG: coproporphyrinogen dehydrogenase HemZ, partial [Ruminococcus sp.]|nr:coproporphyrinogen dehydrogenase HemZ [Ruminococcus sp.]
MNLYTINHKFHYELENLTRAFFPNEKINVIQSDVAPIEVESPSVISSAAQELSVTLFIDEFNKKLCLPAGNQDDELEMATLLYKLLSEYTGISLSWGLLTGVRPIKLLRRLKEEMGEQRAKDYFSDSLLVSKEKLQLASVTCVNEQKILDMSKPDSFSLYISIPFCP